MTRLADAARRTRLFGLLLSLGYGLLAYAAFFLVELTGGVSLSVATLLFPVLIGMSVQFIWDPLRRHSGNTVWGRSLLVTLAMSLVLLIAALETIICIAMAFPIFMALQGAGVWLARLIIGEGLTGGPGQKLKASPLLLPLLVPFIPDLPALPERFETVVSEVVIAAPVEAVWAETLEIPEIGDEERVWTVSHMLLGAPQPVDAVLVGDIRHLRWTKGVRFQEHVTRRDEFRALEWDFVFHDAASLVAFDPHISPAGDELHLIGGGYVLSPQADGSTLLRLETHYRLNTPFNSYLKLWGDLFLSDFHRTVLTVIKERAEAGAGPQT
jgi:hypothetical protein